jgi:predicted RNA-binding protein with PUA-like domain
MAYWLLKSEPHLVVGPAEKKAQRCRVGWRRNFQARKNMRAMRRAISPSSIIRRGEGVVGIVKVVAKHADRPTARASGMRGRWREALARPVTLAEIRPNLA